MTGQLLLSVGPSGSLLLTGKDGWMLNIPYQRTSIIFIDSYTDNFYSQDHVLRFRFSVGPEVGKSSFSLPSPLF